MKTPLDIAIDHGIGAVTAGLFDSGGYIDRGDSVGALHALARVFDELLGVEGHLVQQARVESRHSEAGTDQYDGVAETAAYLTKPTLGLGGRGAGGQDGG